MDEEPPATDVPCRLETVKKLGMRPVEVSLPDWPYDSLQLILFAEGAAAFEELTLKAACANSSAKCRTRGQIFSANRGFFRPSISCNRPLPPQSRRRNGPHFSEWIFCSCRRLRDEMLTITNFTGQPSLTLRAGFVNVSEARSDWRPIPKSVAKIHPPRRVPHGVTLIGRLFEEGTLCTRASRSNAPSPWPVNDRKIFRFSAICFSRLRSRILNLVLILIGAPFRDLSPGRGSLGGTE